MEEQVAVGVEGETGLRLERDDEVARASGVTSARAEMKGMLELFVLEKAVYELKYEIDNRPDWVRIPLIGLLDTLQRSR